MIDTDIRLQLLPLGLRFDVAEAAWNHGHCRPPGKAIGWLFFGSDINVRGEIDIAVAASGGRGFWPCSRWCRGRSR